MNFDEFNWMQTSKVGAWGLEGCPNYFGYVFGAKRRRDTIHHHPNRYDMH